MAGRPHDLTIISRMRDYKQLKVWERAHAFAVAVDDLIRDLRGPTLATFRSQLGRAADSIATNIVEGCGAASQKEFARYLDISIKSANETEYHLLNGRDLRAIPSEASAKLSAEVIEIRRMLCGLRKRVLAACPPDR